MSEPAFHVDVDQNEFLPEGSRTVDAIATITSTGEVSDTAAPTQSAEIIIIDTSGSMGADRRMESARFATCAAIDTLRDGVLFAVIGGSGNARLVYPLTGQLVPADAQTRDQAKRAVSGLKAAGGTAIGTWLALANHVFAAYPNAIRHAILLTDGKNESETIAALDAALRACAGNFTCDARGVGTNWVVEELRKIASALLGTFDIVAEPADLADDFRSMMTQAMGKVRADIRLRLWTPQGASVKFVKLVEPEVRDLSASRIEAGAQLGDYPTGAWGAERRDYHVCVEINPGAVGEEILAGRVRLVEVAPDGSTQILGQGLIRAVWTDDVVLSTRINPSVAHYTGQAELADVIQEGMEARRVGDEDTATSKLGRAVQLAKETGNEGTAKLLAKVVDVIDEDKGTVALKRKVSDADSKTLETRSVRTTRTNKA